MPEVLDDIEHLAVQVAAALGSQPLAELAERFIFEVREAEIARSDHTLQFGDLDLLTRHDGLLQRRHLTVCGTESAVGTGNMLAELGGIQETVLLYQADRGRPRARRMLTDMSPTQQRLYNLFDLDRHAPRR